MYITGYPMFQTLTLGGQTKSGYDATNELTYLCLQATEELKLPQPTVICRIHRNTPHEFMLKASKSLIEHGGGLPSF